MKILLADDHKLFKEALVLFIERTVQGARMTTASDMNEVNSALESSRDFDVVLLDFRMPGMKDMAGIKLLKDRYPDLRVALISGTIEKEEVEEAHKLGICGYFPKTMPGKALVEGLQKIMAGEEYFARDYNTQDYMRSYNHGPDDNRPKALNGNGQVIKLTPREKEVLGYLKKGMANKEIARELDLQVVTVKLHVRGICRKLDAKNRTQAAMLAGEYGL